MGRTRSTGRGLPRFLAGAPRHGRERARARAHRRAWRARTAGWSGGEGGSCVLVHRRRQRRHGHRHLARRLDPPAVWHRPMHAACGAMVQSSLNNFSCVEGRRRLEDSSCKTARDKEKGGRSHFNFDKVWPLFRTFGLSARPNVAISWARLACAVGLSGPVSYVAYLHGPWPMSLPLRCLGPSVNIGSCQVWALVVKKVHFFFVFSKN